MLLYHEGARWVGLGWMVFGIFVYVYYRLSEDKPLLKRITVPEKVLTRKRTEAEYGSILVPILGRELDDDIVQTAGRLASEDDEELGEGGAVIEALWIFEVPLALPLDTPVPDAELKRGPQGAGPRQGRGGGVRGRRGGHGGGPRPQRRRGDRPRGQAPRRRGDRPRGRGAGPACAAASCYGGKEGLRDTFVGETTRYVVNKAPCRVILTAPPAAGADPTRVADEPADLPTGHLPGARTLGSRPMFVLVVGAGRVGSSVATSALRAGHTVSVLDEDPLSHERLDVELGQSWEEAGGRFTIGTALELDALVEAGIEEAQVFIASTNGDNTNLVVAQIAQKRFEVPQVIARVLDPRRAAWYSEQGVQTICPTQIAIEQLEQAALADA